MKIFYFYGSQNYSSSFGWKDDMSINLGKEVSLQDALEDQDSMAAYNGWTYCLGTRPEKGIYGTIDNYGGRVSFFGYVIAKNEKEASALLERAEQSFNK